MTHVKDKFINIYNIIRIDVYNYATLEREKKKSISSLEDEIMRIIFDNNNENEEKTAKHYADRDMGIFQVFSAS